MYIFYEIHHGFGLWYSAWMSFILCSLVASFCVSHFGSIRPWTTVWTTTNLENWTLGNKDPCNLNQSIIIFFQENPPKMSPAKQRPFYSGLRVLLSGFCCLWIRKGRHVKDLESSLSGLVYILKSVKGQSNRIYPRDLDRRLTLHH